MKAKITTLDKVIIRILIQNNLEKIYYNKDIYSIREEEKNIYHFHINYNHISFFRIENNKIVINKI